MKFEILKEFMIENAKGFANTRDFFNKVNEKTGEDYWYFAEQYFYSPNQPELEYYQTNSQFSRIQNEFSAHKHKQSHLLSIFKNT